MKRLALLLLLLVAGCREVVDLSPDAAPDGGFLGDARIQVDAGPRDAGAAHDGP